MLHDITTTTLAVITTSMFFLMGVCCAHGDHGSQRSYNSEQEYNEPIPAEFNGSWQRWHMSHEHDLDDFTPSAFFQLHAVSDPDLLTSNDILRMYGLQRDEVVGQGDGMGDHDKSEDISPELKGKVVNTIMGLMDKDHDGTIDMDEWLEYSSNGGEFPDFGLGPGHEYDFEEEYEKHHWLKYHAENDPDVEILHKEDIEHELLHHFHEIEHSDSDNKGKRYNIRKPIITKNIPNAFKFKQQ